MPRWLPALAILAALAGAVLGIMILLRDRPGGIARFWTLFGPADQGPVDFATLARRPYPNDALVCPPGLCAARSDLPAPVFTRDVEALRQDLRRVVLASGDAEQVAVADGRSGDRYVVRTPLMRFPDTVEVLVLPQPGGRSTLAIYSRSLVGRGDFGANLARIRRWLADPALAAASLGDGTRAPD